MEASSLDQAKNNAIKEFLTECVKQDIPVYDSTEIHTGIMTVLTELLRRTKPHA
jgi:hypothetical protein